MKYCNMQNYYDVIDIKLFVSVKGVKYLTFSIKIYITYNKLMQIRFLIQIILHIYIIFINLFK